MKKNFVFLLSGLLPSCLLFAASITHASSDSTSIQHFKNLQIKYRNILQGLEKKIDQKLGQSQKLSLNEKKSKFAFYYMDNLEENLQNLSQNFQENRLRIEVLDRILFAIENDFKGGSLKQFLEAKLLHLAKRELLSGRPDQRIWKFLIYQSVAIRELAPKQNQVAEFFESYMNYSTLLSPKMPQEYLEDSHYGHPGMIESISNKKEKDDKPSTELKETLERAVEKLTPKRVNEIKTSSFQSM